MDDLIPPLDIEDEAMFPEDIETPQFSPLTPPTVATPVHGSMGDELDVPDVANITSVPDVATDSLLDYESASSDVADTSADNISHTSKSNTNISHSRYASEATTDFTNDLSNNDNFEACS